MKVARFLFLASLALWLSNGLVTGGPLETWVARHPVRPSGFSTVSYLNGSFYSFGNDILSSPDGTNWLNSSRAGQPWAPLAQAAYGNGRIVAVGGFSNPYFDPKETGAIGISTDGRSWIRKSDPALPRFTSIAYGQGRFLAVSMSGAFVWSSPDGELWTKLLIPRANYLYSVAYGSGWFVLTGGFDRLQEFYGSQDGVNWKSLALTLQPASIVAGADRFVAGSTVLIPAPDGSWQIHPTQPAVPTSAYGQGVFAGFVETPSGPVVSTSPDGMSWSLSAPVGAPTPEEPLYLNGVVYGNGLWVGVGWSGLIVTSPDAVHWSYPQPSTTLALVDLSEGDGLLVAVGGQNNSPGTTNAASVILTSTDGRSWANQNVPTKQRLASVAHGSGTFVAVGGDTQGTNEGAGTILVSTNGIEWRQSSYTLPFALTKVIYGNGMFVAIGHTDKWFMAPELSTAIISSVDGFNWTTRLAAHAKFFNGIAYGAGRFVLAAHGLNGHAMFSTTNLVDWSGPFPNDGGIVTWGLSFGNGRFRMAGIGVGGFTGTDGVFVSPDGLEWTLAPTSKPQPDPVISIPGGFVGLWNRVYTGESYANMSIMSSTDGVNWATRDSGALWPLNGVAYARKSVFALGDRGSILQSGFVTPTVRHPPTRPDESGWSLMVDSDPGDAVALESSSDLVSWSRIQTATNVTGTVQFIDVALPDQKKGYYRAIAAPVR